MSSDDSALEFGECQAAEHTLRHLFKNGGIWAAEASGTLTHLVMQVAKGMTVFIDRGARAGQEVVLIGQPSAQTLDPALDPKMRAVQFYDIFVAFLSSHFPQWETGQLFSVFDLKTDMPLADRVMKLRKLCTRFDKKFADVNRLMFGCSLDGNLIGASSLWERAVWHAEHGAPALKTVAMPNKPSVENGDLQAAVRKHKFHLRWPLAHSVSAWLGVLRDLTRHAARADVLQALELIEIYVSRLASTGSVERWFGHIAKLELKQRAHKIKPDLLEASLKLRIQDLAGIKRPGETLSATELLCNMKPCKTVEGTPVVWPASAYTRLCQQIYADFYGTKRLACRDMAWVKGRGEKLHRPRSRLQLHAPKRSERSIASLKKRHDMAIGAAVGAAVAATSAASEEAARAGSIVAPAPAPAARAATVAAASGAASSVVPPCPRKRPTLLDPSIRLIDLAARLHEEPAAKKPRKSASSAPCSVPQHVRLGEQPVPTTRHVTQCPPLHKKPDLKKIDAVMECSEPASSSSAASSSTVKAKAKFKGEASADKLTTSLEKQKFVAAKRLEAHDRAVPGKPVEYVPSCGDFFEKAVPSLGVSVAMPLALPMPVKIYTCPGLRVQKALPGFDIVSATVAQAIVVQSVWADVESPTMLLARLYGKRVADQEWLFSSMKVGLCICFKNHVQTCDLTLLASPAFCKQWPDHVKILKEASRDSKKLKKSKVS